MRAGRAIAPSRATGTNPMSNAEQSEEEIRQGLERGRVFVSWRLLRSIGNSRAAKLTVLIPLIGYLILLNDSVVAHLGLFGEAADTTLTRLLAIYCGLVFIAIASVIFVACCPREVKRYASSEEYVAGDEPFMSDKQIAIMQRRLELGDAVAREEYAGYNEYYGGRPSPDDLEELRRRARQLNRIQMNLYYEMRDRSCRVGRWAAAIFYLAGLAFLLLPSALVFLHVMGILGHRVFGVG
jgi:hypothetical protein